MSEFKLKPGDTIACASKHEVLRLMHCLKADGYKVTSNKKVIKILDGGDQDGSIDKG